MDFPTHINAIQSTFKRDCLETADSMKIISTILTVFTGSVKRRGSSFDLLWTVKTASTCRWCLCQIEQKETVKAAVHYQHAEASSEDTQKCAGAWRMGQAERIIGDLRCEQRGVKRLQRGESGSGGWEGITLIVETSGDSLGPLCRHCSSPTARNESSFFLSSSTRWDEMKRFL